MIYFLLFSMILISISTFFIDNCYGSHISYKEMENVIDTSIVIVVASLINTGDEDSIFIFFRAESLENEGKILEILNINNYF